MAQDHVVEEALSPPLSGGKRLWQFAFTHKILVISACLLSIISVIFTFLPYIAIYLIIQELLKHFYFNVPLVKSDLIAYGWLACGTAILAILFNMGALACSHIAAFKTLYQMKLAVIKKLSILPLGFYSNHTTGELRKIIDEDIEKIELFIAHQLPDLVGSFATPFVILSILLFLDWRLGVATLVPVVLAYIVLFASYGQKGAAKQFNDFHRQQEMMNSVAVEYVRGISVIRAFNQTFFSFKKFHDTVKGYSEFCQKITDRFETSMGLFLVLLNNVYLFLIPVVILLISGVDNYFNFTLSVIFYLVFSVAIAGPFLKLMYLSNSLNLIVTGVDHINEILASAPLPSPTIAKRTKNYAIHFSNVCFSYQQNKVDTPLTISNVTFTAKENAITALVGPSGSGKSTIANLIPRFFDVDAGSIKIGDVDIREMDINYLQSLISFVFQDSFLFKGTVLDNLCIGNHKATMEDVITATKATQCHDFIRKLPDGYQTIIGAKGIHLSGGERQRLIFARAVIKNAPILILDEATAFADPENEHKIQQAMLALMKNRTTIIIAHRLSSIINAEHILVLNNGSIAESGKHDALLSNNGLYQNMWKAYTQTLDWAISTSK